MPIGITFRLLLLIVVTFALGACAAPVTAPAVTATDLPAPTATDVPPEPAPTEEVEPTEEMEEATEVVDEGPQISAEFTLVQESLVLTRGEVGEWDSGVMRFPYVVQHDGMFHMFFEARAQIGKSLLAIGYASSPDGREWTKYEDNPIFAGDGTGFDSETAARPVVSVSDDGTWTMYYSTRDSAGERAIGRASAPSPTGPWERLEGAILTGGSSSEWDHGLMMPDQIVETEDGLRLYFTGRRASGASAMIGLATSTDGLTWEKYRDPSMDTSANQFSESAPILRAGPGWDSSAAWTPNVFQTEDGWMMIYNAFGSLGLAFSEDGLQWSKYEDNPVHRSVSLFHPFVIVNDDGSYWIYYRSLNDEAIHLLEGTLTFE